MPKTKTHIIEKKKDYISVALCIATMILCILFIGRIGSAGGKIALFLSFIFGDFSTAILAFIFGYSLYFMIRKKKLDVHHISFIGCIFIYIAVSMFAHLGLYDGLNMTNRTVLSKTLRLYRNYLESYETTYSCGGGIIAAILVQMASFLLGKTGTILLGLCFILIGISFLVHFDWFAFLRGGKITQIPKRFWEGCVSYVKNIHYPNLTSKKTAKRLSLSILEDQEEPVHFSLQNEINKEKLEDLKRFLRDEKIYGMADMYYTSYSSSRIPLRFAHKSEADFKKIAGFFQRRCFYLKKNEEYSLEFANQFRKLLTLKSMLISEKKDDKIPLATEINQQVIRLDSKEGKLLVLYGDIGSGIRTFLRCFLVTLFLKEIPHDEIYFYDFENDFSVLQSSSIRYINNERSAEIALDEAFSEYERRSEVLKYLDCQTITEANEKIKKSQPTMTPLFPIFHILYVDLSTASPALLQKISYAIRFTLKVGIQLMICCRNKNAIGKLDLNQSDLMVFQSSDVSTSVKLFGSDMACRLQKKGDVLIRINGQMYHGQTPYISTKDFENVMKRI